MSEIVECLSSSSYEERPLALTWEGQRHTIAQILARWRTPGEMHFRVRTEAGSLFEIIYHQEVTEEPASAQAGYWQIRPILGG